MKLASFQVFMTARAGRIQLKIFKEFFY